MIPPETIAAEFATLKAQMERIVSDMESEKDTRRRANIDLTARLDQQDERQRKSDRIIYMGLGVLAVLQVLLQMPK